jgi:hypothetical protein
MATVVTALALSNAQVEMVEYLIANQQKREAQRLLNEVLGADGKGSSLAVDYRSSAKFLQTKLYCDTQQLQAAAATFSSAVAEAKTAFGEDSARYREVRTASSTNPVEFCQRVRDLKL